MFQNVGHLKVKHPPEQRSSSREDVSRNKSRQNSTAQMPAVGEIDEPQTLSQTLLKDTENKETEEQTSFVTTVESTEGELLNLVSPVRDISHVDHLG